MATPLYEYRFEDLFNASKDVINAEMAGWVGNGWEIVSHTVPNSIPRERFGGHSYDATFVIRRLKDGG